MTSKWRLSTLIRCFGPLYGKTQQTYQANTQTDVALLCARIEALERENELLRDEVQASREREDKLLDAIARGLLKASKHRKGKGKRASDS